MSVSGTTQIENGLKMIWSIAKINCVQAIDKSKTNNPLLRIYFDSDLGSPVEKSVEQAYAITLFEVIKENLPDWKIANKAAKVLGNALGKIAAKALDVAKLNYKYFKNQINIDQYTYEATKRTLCTVATLIDNSWDFIGNTIKGGTISILTYLGVDYNTAQNITEKASTVLNVIKPYVIAGIKSKKVVSLVAEGVKKVAAGVKKVVSVVSKNTERIPSVVTTIAQAIEKPVEKVISFAKETTKTIVDNSRKAGNWLLNKIKSIW